jgi:3-deoxy-D-manno-octulosonate 8-phosphate phosphatase KdsC-like HAD superfamily phosphatase
VSARVLLIDCDGVLTDGALTIDRHGEKMFKRFHTRDVRAIRELVYNGWEVVIVTADDWPGVSHFAEKVGVDVFVTNRKGELPFTDYVAVGDDAWDVPMLEQADRAFCPCTADRSVRAVDGIEMLEARGGQGVVAELARRLLG